MEQSMDNFSFLIQEGEQDLYVLAKTAEELYSTDQFNGMGNITRQFLECVIGRLCDKYAMPYIKDKYSGNIILSDTMEALFENYLYDNKYAKFISTCRSVRVFGNNCSHYDLEKGIYDAESEANKQLNNTYYIAMWYFRINYNVNDINENYTIPPKAKKTNELEKKIDELLSQITQKDTSLQDLQDNYKTLKQEYDEILDNNISEEELNKQVKTVISERDTALDEITNLNLEKQKLYKETLSLKEDIAQINEKFDKINKNNKILLKKNSLLRKNLQEKASLIVDLQSKVDAANIEEQEITEENDNELFYNETTQDVLDTIRLFASKGLWYINYNTISQFLLGESTNQINRFSLFRYKNYGKYKDNSEQLDNLRDMLYSIAQKGIIKYPDGNIEYFKDIDTLTSAYNTKTKKKFTYHCPKNIQDFTRLHTIEYLYKKYKDKIPICIRPTNWKSEYYIIVDYIDEKYAYGQLYENSSPIEKEINRIDVPKYYLVRDMDILSDENKEKFSKIFPNEIDDYIKPQCLRDLIKKYSEVYPICVQKTTWYGNYYFRVESIKGNIAYGQCYSDGKIHKEDFSIPLDEYEYYFHDDILAIAKLDPRRDILYEKSTEEELEQKE